jgi:hypothetical protein
VASNFPTSLDNFTNPSSGNTLDSPSHSLQHSDINDAVEALEAKLGIGASPAGSATSGQVLTAGTAGTTTWSTPTGAGLVLINTTTFTGATTVSFANDTFTTTYDNYRILLNVSASSGNPVINFRMRLAGTDNSGSSYSWAGYQSQAGSLAVDAATSQTSAKLFENYGAYANLNYAGWDLFSPKLAVPTKYTILSSGAATAGQFESYSLNGFHDVSTAYDSLSVIPSTGTITGSYAIYGYSK